MILTDLIKKAVENYSSKIFIVDRELYRRKEYSYEEIYRRAEALGGFFFENKIKKGDKILIYLPNSSNYSIILWACALSGVIAVPIDFNNKTDFVDTIYNKVKAKLVFCSVFKASKKGNKYY